MASQKVRLSDREMKCLIIMAEQREQWKLIDPLDANDLTHDLCVLAIQNLDRLMSAISGIHFTPEKQETVEQQLMAPVVSLTPLKKRRQT